MVSIIIVNYRVKEELFACIQSIYVSKPKASFEIIVVDNDEKRTIDKPLKKRFPKVSYSKNINKGFGQGNNVGARNARGDYLLFLNPDTIVYTGMIDTLAHYLSVNKKVGIVAPLLYETNGNLVRLQGARKLTPLTAVFAFSFIQKFFPNNPIFRKYWYLDEWNKKLPKEVESVPGTAFMIRQEIYKKLRGFDEKFFLYFEEHDLCERVRKQGWKIVMHPGAKVSHILGRSTKKLNQDVKKIFLRSRYYYLKKHFGLFKALVSEVILRTNKYGVMLLLLVSLGLYLRLCNITNSMGFIGDQGWFYLSARDMLTEGEFPLVGIVSSHPWLHQGAFWSYLLGFGFKIFGFNPFIGAYISVIIDCIGIIFLYKFGSTFFSRQFGIVAAALYATSPFVIGNARMPYHTSPISLLTLFALYCLYQWIAGKKHYFPPLIMVLAILYNFELATFLLSIIVLVIWVYGILRKQFWARQVFEKKILLMSFGGWLVIMLPMLLYDIHHSFSQTFKFIAWIGYRILVAFGYPTINPITPVSFEEMVHFVMMSYQQILFSYNEFITVLILAMSTLFILIKMNRDKNKNRFALLLIINVLLVIGLFMTKTPSYAYLPMVFPSTILLVALLFDWMIGNSIKKIRVIGAIGLLFFMFSNSYFVYQSVMQDSSFSKRFEMAKYIVKTAGEKEYNLKGKGSGSEFDSYTMNYEYLTWWLGHGPSKQSEKLLFIIDETQGKIIIKE